ncbi:MAG: outer membrane protein assembly factor BamD, partial [Candidatus Eisenbacteria bacterium]|nr:outer membrane protein assembly factor BamD [Candidatus Eisenbacteria bacterium]
MSGGHAARWVGIAAALAVLSSCAYYNTYYLARKYYMAATDGLPYPVDKTQPGQAGNFQKAADLSKKVVVEYSKSKWADDAYLLWARALLGKEDPLQTIIMLQDFERRFPASALRNESTFYLGVAMRQARKYREALVPLDEFIAKAPRHDLIPYAHLERARALMALQEPGAAAAAAGQVIDRYPNSVLVDQARAIRAEGLLAGGDPARARADFQALGADARTDDDRFEFLLREADCLESARDYGSELALLNDAIAHQVAPPPVLPGQPMVITAGSGADRYGRLELRIGTAKLLSGKNDEALADF